MTQETETPEQKRRQSIMAEVVAASESVDADRVAEAYVALALAQIGLPVIVSRSNHTGRAA